MSLVPYGLARQFLFQMDAEVAHDLTMSALALTQNSPLQVAYCQSRVDDPIELAGLTFPNRVGMAAGLDKNARCIDGVVFGKAARDRNAGVITDVDNVATFKLTLHRQGASG